MAHGRGLLILESTRDERGPSLRPEISARAFSPNMTAATSRSMVSRQCNAKEDAGLLLQDLLTCAVDSGSASCS